MKQLLSILLLIATVGCSSTRVIDAKWNQRTRDEIADYERPPERAFVAHSIVRGAQVRVDGPVTQSPFLTADSLFIGRGYASREVRELVVSAPSRNPGVGILQGIIAGVVVGGVLGRAFVEAMCWGSNCGPYGQAIVTGAVLGAVPGALIGRLLFSSGTETIRYRFDGGSVAASGVGATVSLDLNR